MQSIFRLSWYERNLIVLFLWYKTLCKTQKKTLEFHLYCRDYVYKANRWCLVDCFHGEFGVSTQIKVSNYCISKCKMFSTCDGLLVALWAIFLRFKIFTSIRTLACKSNNMQTWFFMLCQHRTSTLLVHCLGNFLSVRPVDERRRHLEVIFYSRCCIMGSGVGVLARKIRLRMSGGGIMNYTL